MDKYLFTINGHDFVTKKMYDFRDTYLLECVHKENIAFREDILNSSSHHIKTIYNNPKIKVIILNLQV